TSRSSPARRTASTPTTAPATVRKPPRRHGATCRRGSRNTRSSAEGSHRSCRLPGKRTTPIRGDGRWHDACLLLKCYNDRTATANQECAMCRGDDASCPDFEEHFKAFRGDLDAERRGFLKSSFAATGGVAALAAGGMSLVTPALAQASKDNQ